MLPPISHVLSVELIRDGGSLGALFQCDGNEYSLFLKLLSHFLPSGEMERIGYASPVLIDHFVSSSIDISWENALVLISQIKQLVQTERDIEWLGIMEQVVISHGVLPPGMTKVLGVPRIF